MAAKDIYHTVVIEALCNDGWTITDDPLTITYGSRDVFVDLGVEQTTIGAFKEGKQLAIEVKSFLNPSAITDLHRATGQFVVYEALLKELKLTREVYVAVPLTSYHGIFTEEIGQLMIRLEKIKLVIFDVETAEIVKWIN
jgi:hypothetical protein